MGILQERMCEASKTFLWDLGDRVGSGATSIVYKAYNKETGQIAAAKVSKVERRVSHFMQSESSIFDREIQFLKNINHPNIVRYIGREMVTARNDTDISPNREVLFLEFCNGGSLSDVLQQPANRFGLPEDTILQIMRDVISGLKYLHQRQIIHRDIKPDNILQSIEIDGKTTYKLTDLGVARRINPGELSTDSICGTVEFVHPMVFCQHLDNIKIRQEGKKVTIRARFPFEVEMWSFGVTIYQCATGRIPFQPYEGTRADQETMRDILTKIPSGCISGIQSVRKGPIHWSRKLPDWCRLSANLKEMLEHLLARLFETDQDHLMKHEQFFMEIEHILSFIPVYYLNLKRLTSTCAYFQKTEPINKLFDQTRKENGDDDDAEYFCLFQNMHYPISKSDSLSVEKFYGQLPVEPSADKRLIIYTYSILKFDQKSSPKVDIPEIQPIKNLHDRFFSVHEWSKNIIGHLFYIKNQLIEYEYILKITESSIMTIHRTLKTKLFRLLCAIRNDISDYQSIYELDRIISFMGIGNHDTSTEESTPRNKRRSIVKTADSSESITSEEQSLEKIEPLLRSSIDFYGKLTEYDRDLSKISDEYFNDQIKAIDDQQQTFLNTTHILKQIGNYSRNIQRVDKYVNIALDLSDKFRRDTLVEKSTSLHQSSHIIRKNVLEELHTGCIRLVNQESYPIILDIFTEYKKWIQLQGNINNDIERIQTSYKNQTKKSLPTTTLRQIVCKELQKLNTRDNSLSTDQSLTIPPVPLPQQSSMTITNSDEITSQLSTTNFSDVYLTMQRAVREAEANATIMDDAIRQLKQLLNK